MKACLQREPTNRPTVKNLLAHPFLAPSVMRNADANGNGSGGGDEGDAATAAALHRLVTATKKKSGGGGGNEDLLRHADAISQLYAALQAVGSVSR
jgi:hypothetical protein